MAGAARIVIAAPDRAHGRRHQDQVGERDNLTSFCRGSVGRYRAHGFECEV